LYTLQEAIACIEVYESNNCCP